MYSSYYLHEQAGKCYQGHVSVSGCQLICSGFWWFPIARPGPPISLDLKNTTQDPVVSYLDKMSDRATTVPPTPPSSNAADIQDGFGQLIQHNSSFQPHSNSFEGGSSQMSPGGSPLQGIDDTLYSNGVYQYSNGQELFQHDLPPNIRVGAGYVG